jgi:vitamin-K-epoxide reductase (warfarin-sensitive)
MERMMKWTVLVLALAGVITASLALREHYRSGASPCRIDDKWDCGIVNHSPYAVFYGVPVALIGIAGYLVLGGLAIKKVWKLLFPAALIGLLFSLYLTRIEAKILEVWCIYCVISLAIISLITLSAGIALLARSKTSAPGG